MRLTRPFGLPDGRVGGAPPPVAFVRPRASLGPVSLAPRSSSDHVSWSDVVVVNEGNGMVRCRGRASARRVTAKKGTETAVKVARIRPCGCRPCPACNLPDGHMRGREIPGPGPILSRFCSDLVLSRDNPSNSGSQGPLRDHTYHITNVSAIRKTERRYLSSVQQAQVARVGRFQSLRTNSRLQPKPDALGPAAGYGGRR